MYVAVEAFWVPKLTVWAIIQKYKVHGMIFCLSGSDSSFKLACVQLQHLAQMTKQIPILAPFGILHV